MAQPLKIAAVFATMNRRDMAVQCVMALKEQTHPPDFVVVADNHSSDQTAEWLEAIPSLPFQLIVHRMTENLGNAGGVNEACRIAFGLGVDFTWILDDDSIPRRSALAALISEPPSPGTLRHALQIDPNTGNFTWPMWITSSSGERRLTFSQSELPNSKYISTLASWTGLFLSQRAWQQTGPVNSSLFIRGEDEEYPWRLACKGFRFEVSRDSILDHPGPLRLIHWQMRGLHFFFEPGLTSWKSHYKIRNMVWLKRAQSGRLRAIAVALTYAWATFLHDGFSKLPTVFKAAWEGWIGRLGRIKDGPPP
jgi:rhamnopyranosyl-N-acetylglucosaminyl-diphospho-decaprenol beta-1,3/1,4-galactofuranosyltransferase